MEAIVPAGLGFLRPTALLIAVVVLGFFTTPSETAQAITQSNSSLPVAVSDTGKTPDRSPAHWHDSSRSSIDPLRFGIVTGVSAGAFLAGHVFFSNLWYKDEKVDFYFTWGEDWTYALGADKLGHAVLPYIGTDLYRQAFEWTGMNREASLWTAAVLSSMYTNYIEIRDGFSIKWGFSWGDWGANTLGIGWRVLEHYEPALENVRFKISYYPSEAYQAGQYDNLIDDYESTYHWASVNIDPLLPHDWRSAWPDWINLSIGHSVKNIVAYDGTGHHEFFIGLDWDTEGLPGVGAFWQWLKRTINYYHLPAPAVRIAPDVVFYGLKF